MQLHEAMEKWGPLASPQELATRLVVDALSDVLEDDEFWSELEEKVGQEKADSVYQLVENHADGEFDKLPWWMAYGQETATPETREEWDRMRAAETES